VLACYGGAGFDENLRAVGVAPGEPSLGRANAMLVDLATIYADS
jgi:hypothetical protein